MWGDEKVGNVGIDGEIWEKTRRVAGMTGVCRRRGADAVRDSSSMGAGMDWLITLR